MVEKWGIRVQKKPLKKSQQALGRGRRGKSPHLLVRKLGHSTQVRKVINDKDRQKLSFNYNDIIICRLMLIEKDRKHPSVRRRKQNLTRDDGYGVIFREMLFQRYIY